MANQSRIPIPERLLLCSRIPAVEPLGNYQDAYPSKALYSTTITPPESLVDLNETDEATRLSPTIFHSAMAPKHGGESSMTVRRASLNQTRYVPPSLISGANHDNSATASRVTNTDALARHFNESPGYSPIASCSDGSSNSSLDTIGEEVFAIVEHAVETNIAAATGPLRLGINRLNESLRSLQFENTDLKEQNDTLSRQLDLHYRTIEQHSETFSGQTKALNRMFEPQSKNIQATTENLTMVAGLVNHLSQVVMNLPIAINHVVHNTVQQHAQVAIRDVMDAQQQAILEVQARARQVYSPSFDDGFSILSPDTQQPTSPCWSDTAYPQRIREALQPECRHKKGKKLRTLVHKVFPSRQ